MNYGHIDVYLWTRFVSLLLDSHQAYRYNSPITNHHHAL